MSWFTLAGIRKFTSEIFQDVDGGFSMKRTLLFVFAVCFVVITVYVVHYGVAVRVGQKTVFAIPQETLSFLQGVLDKCIDAIKWLGGMILAERTPQAVAAFRGKGDTPAVTANKDTTNG